MRAPRRGAAVGVTSAAVIQAVLIVVGLGVLVAQSQAVLQVMRWVGVVYLALFPQFMTQQMDSWALGLLAVTHPLLGAIQLLAVVLLVHAASRWI